MTLAISGDAVMPLALRSLEAQSIPPGWMAQAVMPALGHLPCARSPTGRSTVLFTAGSAGECSRSTVKNSLAVLVRVMEQAVQSGVIDRDPARIIGWQRDYQRAEDELDDPRSLALPDWQALRDLAAALFVRSADHFGAGATSSSSPPAPRPGR